VSDPIIVLRNLVSELESEAHGDFVRPTFVLNYVAMMRNQIERLCEEQAMSVSLDLSIRTVLKCHLSKAFTKAKHFKRERDKWRSAAKHAKRLLAEKGIPFTLPERGEPK
jgi:translation initiation factor 2B subunit (eIF-2B alpha/beta/delta family)